MLTASQVILSRHGKSKFVVGGVTYEVPLTPLEFDLLSVLSDSRRKSQDILAGFWKLDDIVITLRQEYNRPGSTPRSVIAGISRLREALGPTYRELVESNPAKGYRLRVLRT